VVLLFAALAFAALADLAYWGARGRMQPVPDAGADVIQSVSFSPYRRGEDPLAHITPTQDEISADVASLAGRVAGLRTYTSLEGLDQVAAYASPLGIKVTQGVWLGRDPDVNEREVESAISLANRYPNTITRIVVGNEVLLRRDLTPEQLLGYIRRVKGEVKQPVTYADVWEFWLQNPELASEVDVITIHILPYWEDQPIGIGDALGHVFSIFRRVQAAFPGKKIAIGEVGWPSAGRMRDGARPSLVNEARLVRGVIRGAHAAGIDYNIVEAFDQPWKRQLEGTVGGHWGILDASRKAKFDLSGPVSDDPHWRVQWALSTAFAALATLIAAWRRRPFLRWGAVLYPFAAQAIGTLLVLDGELTTGICWSPFGWVTGGVGMAASLILAVPLLKAVDARACGTRWPLAPIPTAEEALNFLRRHPTRGPSFGERMLGLLQFGFIVGAVVATLALVIDPRYRDFPSEAFLIPAFGMTLLALTQDRAPPAGASLNEEALLVALLLLGVPGVIVSEALQSVASFSFGGIVDGFGRASDNSQAFGWCGVLILLALPWALKLWARRRARAVPPAS
jgi:exo-beta-1,3-glucanase (GH17 family)